MIYVEMQVLNSIVQKRREKNETICVSQKYDLDMNYKDKLGKLGNGDGEFSEPRGIAAYQNEIYVLDSGNSRIQVFNSQFQYQREITLDLLPDYQAGSRYTDIVAGTDGTLYLSTDSMIEEANKIYIVSGEKIE